jgi:transcriptional regulator
MICETPLACQRGFLFGRNTNSTKHHTMYLPPHFNETDEAKLHAVIRAHSFATLVTMDGATPFASHVPLAFLPERGPHGTLIGHVARANPQWRHFASGVEALAIFQGPHAYISPSWYRTPNMVPTWNYVAVHAYGRPRLVEDTAAFGEILRLTIAEYESGRPTSWSEQLPAETKAALMKAIVGFEIELTRLEGKFKLSQNRTPEDIAGAADALSQSSNQTDRELAELMRGQIKSD